MFAGRILDADEPVWLSMLRVQRRVKLANRTVPIVDLVLASTAECHQMVIVTRNVRDFAATGVRVLNPWDATPTPIVV